MNDYLKDYLQDSANQKQFQQDRLLVEVASLIFQEMEEEGISRKQLADALGVSKGRISHYLSGQCNLTLRTIADVFGAMGVRFRPSVESHRSSNDWETIADTPRVYQVHSSWQRSAWAATDGGEYPFALAS